MLSVVLSSSPSFAQTLIPIKEKLSGIAVNPETSTGIAISEEARKIFIIDLHSRVVSKKIDIAGRPRAVAVAPKLNWALVTARVNDESPGQLYVIDLANGSVLTRVSIGSDPQGVAIDEERNLVYIAQEESKEVSVLNLSTFIKYTEIALEHKPRKIAIDTTRNLLLVTAGKADGKGRQSQLIIIDLNTPIVLDTLSFSKEIAGLALNISNGTAVITYDTRLALIDLEHINLSGVITTRKTSGVAVNSSTNLAVTTNPKEKSVVIYDLNDMVEKGSAVEVENRPGNVAIDPYSNIALVTTKDGVVVIGLPNPVPAITAIVPDFGLIGDSGLTLSIDGLGFIRSSKVYFSDDPLGASFVDNYKLEVALPDSYLASVNTYPVTVVNPEPEGGTSETFIFEVRYPVPNISRWDYNDGKLGVFGSNFFPITEMYFNEGLLGSTYVSSEKVVGIFTDEILGTPGTFPLYAVQPDGARSNTVNIRVSPVPEITALVPSEIDVGTEVTVTVKGKGFHDETIISLGEIEKPATLVGPSELTVDITSEDIPDAGQYPLSALNPVPGGGTSNIVNLVVGSPAPEITGFAPKTGPPGTVVTIEGKNFDIDSTFVSFVGSTAVVSSVTETQLKVTLPLEAETGPITVSTPEGTGQSTEDFVVVPRYDFSISASPAVSTGVPGRPVSYNLSVKSTGENTFSGLVSFSVSGLSAGINATFTPEFATVAKDTTMILSIPSTTTTGEYNLTVFGTSVIGGKPVTRSSIVKLKILPQGTTTLSGRIYDSMTGLPLSGVALTLGGDVQYTDDSGYFVFVEPPTGLKVMMMDGHTANTVDVTYPSRIPVVVTILEGEANELPYPIYIHQVNTDRVTRIDNNDFSEIKVRDEKIPNFELTIPQGSKIIGWDGEPNEEISITTLDIDQIPVRMLPEGVNTRTVYMYYFFKPGGGIPTEPIPVTFPNDLGASPREKLDLWYYDESAELDPDSNQWKIFGTGTVSDDGTQVVSDPGVGIPKFCCGASFMSSSNPSRSPSSPPDSGCGNRIGDPVDAGTGAFVYSEADLYLDVPLPVVIGRHFNSQSMEIGAFGRGTFLSYDHALRVNGTALDYMRPEGGSYTFSPAGDGSYVNSTNPFLAGARAYLNGDDTRTLRFKDGLTFDFDIAGRLVKQTDSNGNTVTITRVGNGEVTGDGDITRVTDTFGRSLEFEHITVGAKRFGTTVLNYYNLVSAITGPTGRRVEYTYNTSPNDFRLLKVAVRTLAGGVKETSYGYKPLTSPPYLNANDFNALLTITNERGITEVVNEYNSDRRIVKQTHADGGEFLFDYTVVGGTVTETRYTEPNGHTTTYRMNSALYATEISSPVLGTITHTRDFGTNVLTTTTDPLGREIAYLGDANGNVLTVTDPGGNTMSYEYEPVFNKPTKVTDALGNETRFAYDAKGNLITITDPLLNETHIAYNGLGLPIDITDALGNTRTFDYDEYGSLVTVTDPAGGATTRVYDEARRLIKLIDPKGAVTGFGYDELGRVSSIRDGVNGFTEFSYDEADNLLSLIDPKGQTTTYTYDVRGRVDTMTDPLGASASYTYNTSDDLTSYVDRKGQTTAYTYDLLHRVEDVTYGDGATVTNTYDAAGRLTYIYDSVSGPLEFVYSDDGCAVCGGFPDRVVKAVTPLGTIDYTYDAIGRRATMEVLGQDAVVYNYDGASRLTSIDAVISGSPESFLFNYDPIGRRSSLEMPSGVTTTYSYDGASRLTDITHTGPAGVIGSITSTYDPGGNKTAQTMVNDFTALPAAVEMAYDASNRLVQHGTDTLTYDASGNLLTNGTTSYAWDVRNRLSATSGPGMAASFKYDALGRRIEKTVNGTTTGYLYDGWNIVQEVEGGAVSANYIGTLNIDEPLVRIKSKAHGVRYYQRDGLGSIVALTDKFGNVMTSYTYTPYGETTSTGQPSDNPFQFTGRENDGTGLYYYRYRYYSPELKRFISEDPIGFMGGDVNLFAYVGGNPVNYTDAFGLLLGVNAGEGYGEESAQIYANITVDPCASIGLKAFAWVAGPFASLWTPETSTKTAFTIVGGSGAHYAIKWTAPKWAHYAHYRVHNFTHLQIKIFMQKYRQEVPNWVIKVFRKEYRVSKIYRTIRWWLFSR